MSDVYDFLILTASFGIYYYKMQFMDKKIIEYIDNKNTIN